MSLPRLLCRCNRILGEGAGTLFPRFVSQRSGELSVSEARMITNTATETLSSNELALSNAKKKTTEQQPIILHSGIAPQLSFYRRDLPSNLISFTSDEGKLIFREALAEGYMESYFSLVGNFATQTEPACKCPMY
jgi:hypothetical protein